MTLLAHCGLPRSSITISSFKVPLMRDEEVKSIHQSLAATKQKLLCPYYYCLDTLKSTQTRSCRMATLPAFVTCNTSMVRPCL
jgi:hypothetical protein